MDIKFIMLARYGNRCWSGIMRNTTADEVVEEIRRQVIKAVLDEFPPLKKTARSYLKVE